MPLYEYECDLCGVRFERVQRVTEDPARVCPECGGQVRRLIQPVGIIFKGSGFYVTDHRAKSSTATPGGTKKPAGGSEESKPAAQSSEKSD